MGWFRKRQPEQPVNPAVLKAAAQVFLQQDTGVKRSVYSWSVGLRAELLSRDFDPKEVDRAIAHLLSHMEWR